jgi:hypothetical protein
MPAATESVRARQRVSFGVYAQRFVSIDNFSFDSIALAPMLTATRIAH